MMKQKSIKLSLILLISVFIVGFTSANNQKKPVQKKKPESSFIITKIITHGFCLIDENQNKFEPSYIFEFEVLNNTNLILTNTLFNGYISAQNGKFLSCYPEDERCLKDNWEPKTKRTIKIIMKYPSDHGFSGYYRFNFEHTPENAIVSIWFSGWNIDKEFNHYEISNYNVIEDWKEYQRVLGLRQ